MSIATLEEDVFGDALTPLERIAAGIPAALAAAGHVLLFVATALFVFVLATGA
ncbi:hypothetical protein [Halolamina salina]|uniref:Uncharacterized protein n=1 Tax=Halolamina salina TaxID=1220023 RepID=A0ABD6B3V1_9EURY